MPDLIDGESVEMSGSGSRPYVLKNVGGVYSCSCPAWRNQSLGIERRTCKHLRKLRGETVEEARVGQVLPRPAQESRIAKHVPPLLLAQTWDSAIDPTHWWLSEKLDGVRAYWDGKQFLSRQGNRYLAPAWFTSGLPLEPLDGELWIGRKQFQRTVSIVRRHDASDLWREVKFVIFDAPANDDAFEARLKIVRMIFEINRPPHAVALAHYVCRGSEHLRDELTKIEAQGGEGLMLRQPGSMYETGRSNTLLKVKRFLDSEARVIGHEPGSGRHKGRLGALLVEMSNGIRFAVGTGLTDSQRTNPPTIGSAINFRYQELSDRGVPRFPSFAGTREDLNQTLLTSPQGGTTMIATNGMRRFEFTEGTSNKFWAISVEGANVTIRFGRIGTDGQTQVKTFPTTDAAAKHADRLITEKTKKGYVEV